MKTHLSFATTDLVKSIEFYSILLNASPKRRLADYALFITNQPPLELALDAVDSAPQFGSDHYGIFVETADEVERAIERLERAGLSPSVEREQDCCYANQTKVWAVDPSGRRWEVYTVHEDTDERNSLNSTCCASEMGSDAASGAA